MKFEDMLQKLHPKDWTPPPYLLSLDPGHTTGTAFFNEAQLRSVDQLPLIHDTARGWEYDWKALHQFLESYATLPGLVVVMEDYSVYAHKLQQHTGSNVPTLRLIGAIDYHFSVRGIPVHFQSAQTGKGFCTNDKLKAWGMYPTGLKHAADAVRHGCHHLLFYKTNSLTK